MGTQCVFYEGGTEFLNLTQLNFRPEGWILHSNGSWRNCCSECNAADLQLAAMSTTAGVQETQRNLMSSPSWKPTADLLFSGHVVCPLKGSLFLKYNPIHIQRPSKIPPKYTVHVYIRTIMCLLFMQYLWQSGINIDYALSDLAQDTTVALSFQRQ